MKTARRRRALPRQSAKAAAKFAAIDELEKDCQRALRVEARVEGSRAKGDRRDEWGIYSRNSVAAVFQTMHPPAPALYFGFGTSLL